MKIKKEKPKKEKKKKEVIEIDFTFKNLEDCTRYFYDEYGKYNTVKKKVDNKSMQKDTKNFLKSQFKHALNCVKNFIPKFGNIATCTEYFYNEYGKLNSAKRNLDDKKLWNHICKFLTEQFENARKQLKKQNKTMLSKGNIKETIKQTNQPKLNSMQQNELSQPAIAGVIEDAPAKRNENTQ